MKHFIKYLFVLLIGTSTLFGQEKTDSTEKSISIFPLPVVYYTPETRLAYGAVVLLTFRFEKEEDNRNSQIEIGAAHTQENQLLFYIPYHIYTNQNKYYIFGELRYYRYSYNFYGIGNNIPSNIKETYKVNIPRIRINATKRYGKSTYVGFRYWFDNFNMGDVLEGGLLDLGGVPGSSGGIISALGGVFLRDNRDNYNYPQEGSYLEILALPSLYSFGSEYEFSRISVDYVKYLSLSSKTVLAANGYWESNIGGVPFNEMAFIGGRSRMRGYYEGRYRDKNVLMGQVEFRQTIKGRVGAVAFGGVAAVANNINDFQIEKRRYSGGLGLRYQLDQKDKVNIRLDYGFGAPGNSGLYLTFNEAF